MSFPRLTHVLAIATAIVAFVSFTSVPSVHAQSTRPLAGAGGTTQSGKAHLLPAQSKPFDASLDVWGTRWWQWAYSLPATGHPLFDETGADCAAGQSGPVWFLAGIFNVSGSAVRTECVVPSGKALFFPILNAEWDNFCPPVDPPMTEAQLRATVAGVVDLATDLQCEIDGESVGSLSRYRARGPAFDIQLPDDNLWQAFGCSIAPGTYGPLVQDGYYVMITPLPPGEHTIHFHGTLAAPINFTLDITYELTVAPGPNAVAGGGTSVDVVSGTTWAASGEPGLPTSWGRMKATYR
jgi:hypothetical protein